MEVGLIITAIAGILYGLVSLIIKVLYNGVLLILKILVITHKEYKRTYTRTIKRKGNSSEIVDKITNREV